MEIKIFTLSITVRNKSGVLLRVASLFSKRGYNIESLHVEALKKDEAFSKIIMTSKGDDATKEQIVKQLLKLHDVKEVKII